MAESGKVDFAHTLEPLDAAFYATVHGYKGGAPALAKVIGMKPGILQNKADPNMSHEPTLKQTRSVMLATQDFQVLDVLNKDCGFVKVGVEQFNATGDVGLLQQQLQLDAAHGAFAAALHDALEDNKLNKNELASLEAHGRKMLEAYEGLMARIEACASAQD